jgi:hypothetical protein
MNAKLIGAMAMLLLVGAPVAFFVWIVIDEILSARFEPWRDLAALAGAILFAAFAIRIGRWTETLES